MPLPLRPDLKLETDARRGALVLADPGAGARHEVPAGLAEAIRAALAAGTGGAADPALAAWLETRHLLASERAARVEAWAEGIVPRRLRATLPVVAIEGTRFTCHGCGLCGRSYFTGPSSAEERARYLARAADLAPHVATAPERWFQAPAGEGLPAAATYALGRTADGACVFLGDDNLCNVHRYIGIENKPALCRRFPLAVAERPDAVVVTVGVQCRTLARSRDDGQPLAEQTEWLARVASHGATERVATVCRAQGELFVPFPLARAIERRARALLGDAPTADAGVRDLGDLVFGALAGLEPAPDVPELERAIRAAESAPLERLRAARGGAGDGGRGRASLRALLEALLRTVPRYLAACTEGRPAGAAPTGDDLFAIEAVAILHAALAPGAEAADLPPGGDADPAVADFLRAALVQLAGGGRALAAPPGFVYGFGRIALTYALARFGARLLAARAGRPAAGREEWNRALALEDRLLVIVSLDGAARAVVDVFAGQAAIGRPLDD